MRFYAGFFILMLLFHQAAAQADPNDKKEKTHTTAATEERSIREWIAKELGPSVNPNSYTDIWEALNQINGRLEKSLNDRIQTYGWKEKAFVRFDLVNHKEGVANAYARFGDLRGGQRRHYVVLTSGLLKILLSESDGTFTEASIKRGLQELVPAALAHEYGHMIDEIDPVNSISHRYPDDDYYGRNRWASQAVETRTDAEAIELLKGAGFETTGLHDTFEILKKLGGETKLLHSFVRTHPADDLRLLGQRFQLTADPFILGAPKEPIRPLTLKNSSIAKEMKTLTAGPPPYEGLKFLGEGNREEYFSILKNGVTPAAGGGRHFDERSAGFYFSSNVNEAFWDLDQISQPLVEELKKRPPTPEELEILREMFRSMLGGEQGKIWIQSKGLKKIVEEIPALRTSEFRKSLIDFEVRKKQYKKPDLLIPFSRELYGDIAYRSVLREKSIDLLQLLWGTTPRETIKLIQEPLREQYIKNAPAGEDYVINGRAVWSNIYDSMRDAFDDPAARAAMLEFAISQGPKLDPLAFGNYAPSKKESNFSKEYINYHAAGTKSDWVRSSKPEENVFSDYAKRVASERAPPEEYATLKHLAQEIWNRRGELGFFSLFENKTALDWDGVGLFLGKNSATVQAELKQAVLEFVRSDRGRVVVREFDAKLKTIYEYSLAETRFQFISQDPEFRAAVRESSPWVEHFFQMAELYENPAQMKADVRQAIRHALEAPGANGKAGPASLEDAFIAAIQKHWIPTVFRERDADSGSLRKIDLHRFDFSADLALGIDASNRPLAEKRALLSEMFIKRYFDAKEGWSRQGSKKVLYESFGQKHDWIEGLSAESREVVLSVLRKNGVYQKPSELMRQLREGSSPRWETRPMESIAEFSQPLVEEASRLSDGASVIRFGESVFATNVSPTRTEAHPNNLTRTPQVAEVREAWIARLKTVPLSLEQKLKAFETMTFLGSSIESEDYFKSEVLPELRKADPTRALSERVRSVLRVAEKSTAKTAKPRVYYDRFLGNTIRSELIDKFVLGEVSERAAPTQALEAITTYMPVPSLARDALLEKLAWKLKRPGVSISDRLKGLQVLEKAKASNWTLYSPWVINKASATIDFSRDLKHPERIALIQYLLDPSPGLSPELDKALDAYCAQQVAKETKRSGGEGKGLDRLKVEMKTELMSWAQHANPAEKIVFVDAVSNSGMQPLSKDPGYPGRFWAEVTGKPLSPGVEKRIVDYLNSGKPSQRSASVSFALVSRDPASGDTDLPRLFEAFQTLGKKNEQLFSVLGTFGPEVSAKLGKSKEKATPMSLAEMLEVLDKELPASVRSEIVDIEEVLGSASIKTVVRARMKDGSRQVFAIRRPNAEAQVQAHYERGKRFLVEVEKGGEKLPTPLFKTMLEGMQAQIQSELDFRNEARNTDKGRSLMEELNRRMSGKMKGWKFSVPQIDPRTKESKHVLKLSAAPGNSLGVSLEGTALSATQKEEIGAWIAEANLIGLFDMGFAQADPHNGNFFVDPVSKSITWIDWGQVIEIKNPGERLALASLVKGVAEKNAAAVVSAAKKLRPQGAASISIKDEARVASELQSAMRAGSQDMAGSVSAVLEVLAKNGMELDPQISFGALKNLLYLSKEISPFAAPALIAQTVKRTLLSQPGAMVLEGVKCKLKTVLANTLGKTGR